MLLVTTWFGSFLCENGRVAHHRLFPRDPGEIAKRLRVIETGGVLDEELELLRVADFSVEVAERRLARYGMVSGSPVSVKPDDYGVPHTLLRQSLIFLGKAKSREKPGEDFHAVQALRVADSLSESINLLSERVRDWYSVHFPELARLVPDEKLVSLVAKCADRDEIASQLGFSGESIGSPMEKDDVEAVRAVAAAVANLIEAKARTEKFIGQKMKEAAPNITHVAGPVLGARLISLAGGLGKLASKPSSTIQLLGAENALFRHLKSGAKPPKHGIIFQHPYVHSAPRHHRGRVARSLAGALSIAAKVDYNRGEFIGDKLKEKLERRIRSVSASGGKKTRKTEPKQ
jgi:nucleolar protein 56